MEVKANEDDERFYDLPEGETYSSTVYLEGDGAGNVRIGVDDPFEPSVSEQWTPVALGQTFRLRIVTNTDDHLVHADLDGVRVHDATTTASGTQVVLKHDRRLPGPAVVQPVTTVHSAWCEPTGGS